MAKCILLPIIFSFLSLLTVEAQTSVTLRDTLMSDFDSFINILEQTHPDPYTRFGGKVLFHKTAHELRDKLEKEEFTVRDFAMLLSDFLIRLRDGHSYVGIPALNRSQQENNAELYLPVEMATIPGGLILTKVPAEHKEWIGSRIMAVNGVDIGLLTERAKEYAAIENLYGAYAFLETQLRDLSFLKRLFSLSSSTDKVTFRLLTPNNEERFLSLQPATRQQIDRMNMWERVAWETMEKPADYMSYQFIGKGKQTMLFRLGSMMSRENLIYMRDCGRPSFKGELSSFYQYLLHKEMPEDEEEALAGIPSIAEVFRSMLLQMKEAGASNLIIDLRGNGGGWTPIVYPTLYMLYGDDYLAKDMDAHLYHLISPLYLANRNVSLEDYNNHPKADIDPFHPFTPAHYRMGDYTFEEPESRPIETIREHFVNTAMGNVASCIGDLQGKPLYKPSRVFVVTNERTYSAAFHYVFYLWKMGATVVGVPSSLATNTYMEGTPYQLPLTGISGGLSNSLQVFLPADDRRATVFYPEWMPDYSDYRKYNFDKHAEILYLLDRLGDK